VIQRTGESAETGPITYDGAGRHMQPPVGITQPRSAEIARADRRRTPSVGVAGLPVLYAFPPAPPARSAAPRPRYPHALQRWRQAKSGDIPTWPSIAARRCASNAQASCDSTDHPFFQRGSTGRQRSKADGPRHRLPLRTGHFCWSLSARRSRPPRRAGLVMLRAEDTSTASTYGSTMLASPSRIPSPSDGWFGAATGHAAHAVSGGLLFASGALVIGVQDWHAVNRLRGG
jgi:hypothetical protein